MKIVLVFDVESIGLHGQAYAVGGCFLNTETRERFNKFCIACSPDSANGADSDREWVAKNIPPIPETAGTPAAVREAFWMVWEAAKSNHPGICLAAECGWPVEANFLEACIKDDEEKRRFEGPYPLHEIASFMEAAGMDPMAAYEREEDELPKHCPAADSMQSARLLYTALEKLK